MNSPKNFVSGVFGVAGVLGVGLVVDVEVKSRETGITLLDLCIYKLNLAASLMLHQVAERFSELIKFISDEPKSDKFVYFINNKYGLVL